MTMRHCCVDVSPATSMARPICRFKVQASLRASNHSLLTCACLQLGEVVSCRRLFIASSHPLLYRLEDVARRTEQEQTRRGEQHDQHGKAASVAPTTGAVRPNHRRLVPPVSSLHSLAI